MPKAYVRTMLAGGLLALLGSAHASGPDSRELLFARLPVHARQAEIVRITDGIAKPAEDMQTPMGSLWKLFVYAYVIDRAMPAPDYVCTGKRGVAKEEIYCCDPGQSISRDKALAQSCGLFFDPARLHLDARDWEAYWKGRAPQAHWLADVGGVKPQLMVSVSSLLYALSSIDGEPRARAESALLAVMLNGRGQPALRYLGGRYRVKTYTWTHPQRAGVVFGGGGGWVSDGSAVWFGAVGSSAQVLKDYGPQLAAAVEGASDTSSDARCVDVALFARYPLRHVALLDEGVTLVPGMVRDLRGRVRIEFENGRQMQLQASSELRLNWDSKSRPVLSARLGENEYVARVIDREGVASEKEAAKALSVVVRTYLLQNATKHGECLAIADSSRTQRVSPNPASPTARDIAAFTAGLLLQGANAQYRLDANERDVLSWNAAVQRARQGMLFDEILQMAFEHGSLASVNDDVECKPLPAAQQWLQKQAQRWHYVLQAEPGYVEPRPQVCQLAFGAPYSDMSRQRIYVRGLASLNNRLSLAHEYLHLAFSSYPSGQDEIYVEKWARRLIEGDAQL